MNNPPNWMNELKLPRHEMKRNQKNRKILILRLDKLLFYLFISFSGRRNSPYFSSQGRPFRSCEDFAQQICRCRGCWCGKISQYTLNHSDTNTFAFSFKSFAVLKSLWTIQNMPILLPVSSLWNKRKETELTFIYWNISFQTSRGIGKHHCAISIECVCLVSQ